MLSPDIIDPLVLAIDKIIPDKSPTCGLHLEFPLAITTKFSTDVAKHCAKLYESHIDSADAIHYNKTILPGDIMVHSMFGPHIFGHASLALSHLSSNGVFTLDAATNYYRLHESKHPYFTSGGSSLHTFIYSPTYVARTVRTTIYEYIGPNARAVRSLVCTLGYMITNNRLWRAGSFSVLLFGHKRTNPAIKHILMRYIKCLDNNYCFKGMCVSYVIFMYQVAFMLLGMEAEMFRAMPVDYATTWPTTLNRILNNIPTMWKRKQVWMYGPYAYQTDFTTSDVFGIKAVTPAS